MRTAVALTLRPATAPAPAQDPQDPTALAADVEGVAFPYWEDRFGWRSTGARTDSVDGRTVRTVFYARGHQWIGYAIASGSAPRVSGGIARTRGGTVYRFLAEDGSRVVTWRRGGHLCVVSGHGVSDATLMALASWDTGRSTPERAARLRHRADPAAARPSARPPRARARRARRRAARHPARAARSPARAPGSARSAASSSCSCGSVMRSCASSSSTQQQDVDVDRARAVAHRALAAAELPLQALDRVEQLQRLERRCAHAHARVQERRLVEYLADGVGVVGARAARAPRRRRPAARRRPPADARGARRRWSRARADRSRPRLRSRMLAGRTAASGARRLQARGDGLLAHRLGERHQPRQRSDHHGEVARSGPARRGAAGRCPRAPCRRRSARKISACAPSVSSSSV